MKIGNDGLKLIKNFEGCRLTAYKCPAGVVTIGFGHTGSDVKMGMTITQERADELLKQDLAKFEKGVSSCVKVPLNQSQFDSLVSFAFNCGIGSLQQSTLLKKLNAKDYIGASNEFLKWNKAGGKTLAGLTRRRNAERDLFLKHEEHHTDNTLPYEVKTTTNLNIRIAPSTTSAVIRTVPTGTVLKVWAIQTVGGRTWAKNGAQYFCLDYCKKV